MFILQIYQHNDFLLPFQRTRSETSISGESDQQNSHYVHDKIVLLKNTLVEKINQENMNLPEDILILFIGKRFQFSQGGICSFIALKTLTPTGQYKNFPFIQLDGTESSISLSASNQDALVQLMVKNIYTTTNNSD